MKVVTFVDLDDTLFQTLPKCPPGEDCRAVAYRKDGAPLSYMSRRQARLFEVLGGLGAIIPVTARNLDAFRRVDLPFVSLAILDFGGVVLLPGGAPDPEWDAQIRPQAVAQRATLENHVAAINAFIDRHSLGVRARLIEDFDMPLYAVMKHPDGELTGLTRIASELLPGLALDGFFVHSNGNNLSLAPRFLGKERAVRYVLQRHVPAAECLTMAIGDSLSDIPFMQLCDFLMTPRGTQLAAAVQCLGLRS